MYAPLLHTYPYALAYSVQCVCVYNQVFYLF